MKNALSFDLEDWFCVSNLSSVINKGDWDKCELRVVQNTRSILTLLDDCNTTATFFVLGWIAERIPELVREIDQRGHEIATHGYSHTMLTEMTPELFEEDLLKAICVTEKCTCQKILGFRAPSFTVTNSTMWALDILAKNGIRYDSSIFPVGFHPDYGFSAAPLSIYKHNDYLIEFPLTCVEIMGKRIPCSGGGYFRILPYSLTRFLLRLCNRQKRPFVFYLHPWEIDPEQPRVKLPWLKRFRHYHNLDKTFGRLKRLLNDFEFTSVRSVLGL
jgi:polysaccharide deacetylase family protein (PEP-CTERM system associated)